MASKRCPNCNLVNPGSAMSCDCGYSFSSGELGKPLDLSKPGSPAPMTSSQGSNIAMRVLIWIIVVAVIVAIKVAIRR